MDGFLDPERHNFNQNGNQAIMWASDTYLMDFIQTMNPWEKIHGDHKKNS